MRETWNKVLAANPLHNHNNVMHRTQTMVNPKLILVPLTPITYTSAQLHENTDGWEVGLVGQLHQAIL